MKNIGRTVENVVKDLVFGVLEDITDLKKEPKNDLNFGKMLAYFECLSIIEVRKLDQHCKGNKNIPL